MLSTQSRLHAVEFQLIQRRLLQFVCCSGHVTMWLVFRVVNNTGKKYCNIQYQYQAKKSIANTNTNNSVKKYCNNQWLRIVYREYKIGRFPKNIAICIAI